jgi:hypothetical protein
VADIILMISERSGLYQPTLLSLMSYFDRKGIPGVISVKEESASGGWMGVLVALIFDSGASFDFVMSFSDPTACLLIGCDIDRHIM